MHLIISFLFIFFSRYIFFVRSHTSYLGVWKAHRSSVLSPHMAKLGVKEIEVFYCLSTILNFPEVEEKNAVCNGSNHRLWHQAGPSLSAQSMSFWDQSLTFCLVKIWMTIMPSHYCCLNSSCGGFAVRQLGEDELHFPELPLLYVSG